MGPVSVSVVFIARRLAEIIQGVSADEEEKMKNEPCHFAHAVSGDEGRKNEWSWNKPASRRQHEDPKMFQDLRELV